MVRLVSFYRFYLNRSNWFNCCLYHFFLNWLYCFLYCGQTGFNAGLSELMRLVCLLVSLHFYLTGKIVLTFYRPDRNLSFLISSHCGTLTSLLYQFISFFTFSLFPPYLCNMFSSEVVGYRHFVMRPHFLSRV